MGGTAAAGLMTGSSNAVAGTETMTMVTAGVGNQAAGTELGMEMEGGIRTGERTEIEGNVAVMVEEEVEGVNVTEGTMKGETGSRISGLGVGKTEMAGMIETISTRLSPKEQLGEVGAKSLTRKRTQREGQPPQALHLALGWHPSSRWA
jgi:hypothetical protein